MIIETVQLRHVGPFRGTAAVGPLAGGLNVLAAYNEEGKSTLVKALARALFDRHTCRSGEIELLRPIGTSLAPLVHVEFQLRGQRYRIEKTFLDSPRSQLSQFDGSAWQLVAEGDAADNQLSALMQSAQPGRGATKPEHWGLFQYLWARQGEPAAWPSWDGEAGKTARARLVKIELDPFIETLKASLDTTYGEVFTDTARPRTHGPLEAAETELSRLEEQHRQLRQRAIDLEAAESRFQQLNEQIATLETEAANAKKQADDIAQAAREAELLLKERDAKQKDVDAATKSLQAVNDDIENLRALKTEISELEGKLATVRQTLAGLDEELADLDPRHKEAEATAQNEQAARREIQGRFDRAESLLKYRRAVEELAEFEARSKAAKRAAEDLAKLQRQRDALPSLTDRKLRALQDADAHIGKLNAQIEVLGLSVELTPDKAQKTEVRESGKSRKLNLKAGKTETIKSGQQVELRLESWGRVRIRSGATELTELLKTRDEKQRELKTALDELGVRTVADAAALLEKRKGFDDEIRESNRELKTQLGDSDDLQALETQLSRQRTLTENLIESLRPTANEKHATLSDCEAEVERLRVELRQANERVENAQETARQMQAQLTDRRKRHADSRTTEATTEAQLKGARKRIEEIGGKYPQGTESAKKLAQQQFIEAEARLAGVVAKLPPDADKLPERNRRAARAAQEAAGNLSKATRERDQLTGKLQTLGAEGIYSRETELLAQIAAKRSEANAARQRGWAARLLRDLLERRKQAVTRAVLAPLQQQIGATFADLTGERERQVFLDAELQIRGVGRSESEMLPFDALSQGAKEQLMLALRMAVASAAADSEPQLLILDDVLVNTDPIRQQRVLDLLQTAAERLQILVLTCHADRYRGVGNSCRIEFTAA
jgi:exonuclease SbcC